MTKRLKAAGLGPKHVAKSSLPAGGPRAEKAARRRVDADSLSSTRFDSAGADLPSARPPVASSLPQAKALDWVATSAEASPVHIDGESLTTRQLCAFSMASRGAARPSASC